MGRKVEEAVLHVLVEHARSRGVSDMVADYLATEKNKPCLDFWRRSGFLEKKKHRFVFDCSSSYPKPDCLNIKGV